MYRITTKLAGVLVNGAQKNIRELERKRCESVFDEGVTLIREPENAFDPNAIKVEAGRNYVGYIPKGIAKDLASRMDSGSRFIVTKSWLNKSDFHECVGLTVEITEAL
ncbi:MAG: hypothetical protein JW836_10680 [Deltaproteobacteria bacterium]|nr:hypothetical protein [Deltaproteobacteria bacterium]